MAWEGCRASCSPGFGVLLTLWVSWGDLQVRESGKGGRCAWGGGASCAPGKRSWSKGYRQAALSPHGWGLLLLLAPAGALMPHQ